MCLFNSGNNVGTKVYFYFLMFVYNYVLLLLRLPLYIYVCVGIGSVDWLDEGLMYEKSFETYICFWQSLSVLGWPCDADSVLKSNY